MYNIDSHACIKYYYNIQIFENDLIKFDHNNLNPRLLKLTWLGSFSPQMFTKDIYLTGSRNHRFLTMCLPPICIGPRPAPLLPSLLQPPNTHPINRVELLMDEILNNTSVNNPKGFGMSLGVSFNHVDQIARNYPQDISEQLRQIAAIWFQDRQTHTWEEVVEALFQHGLVHDSKLLANRRGVDWKHN